ncbi:MAG: hypothetical protein FJW40_06645 [Acidobacteria bacterium]|nr:hypothetical protein [Acidobacteriota bacterium]
MKLTRISPLAGLALIMLTSEPLTAQAPLVEGNPSAAVRVLIFEDLQCSDCANFRVMLDKHLLPRFKDRVAFEHRDFPLAKHDWARQAAIVARHFEQESAETAVAWRRYILANLKDTTAAGFAARVRSFAIAHKQAAGPALAALKDSALGARVQRDFDDGVARGVARTPTVFVDGNPFVETFTLDEISKAIETALQAAR